MAEPKRVQINIRLKPETRAILDTVLARDGVPYSAQILRAVRLWAKEKGIQVPHATPAAEGEN